MLTRWQPLIDRYAQQERVPPMLIAKMTERESGGNPRAVSSAGAKGLMQLMPGTARDMGVTDPFDPEQNIRGGLSYLRWLLAKVYPAPQLLEEMRLPAE